MRIEYTSLVATEHIRTCMCALKIVWVCCMCVIRVYVYVMSLICACVRENVYMRACM